MPRPQYKAPEPTRSVKFVSSGSTLLDLVLGGGWAQGRVINLVGDKSAGKTLLAIEGMINFAQKTDVRRIHYEEAESAFDEDYARMLGMPDGISRGSDVRTVEDLERSVLAWLDKLAGDAPALYVLDSLDALSDEAELGRDIGEGSFGGAKAKKLSELFRKHIALFEKKNCTFLVISQLRDNIGVMFGEKHKRSGGRALDFYSSQIVWLSELRKLDRTISKVKRVYGVEIKARTKKNKVGPPFREADMSILFNYGVDDEESMLAWLVKHGALATEESDKEIRKGIDDVRRAGDRAEIAAYSQMLRTLVSDKWAEIEEALKPPMTKYERK